jgi:hypothetical protein
MNLFEILRSSGMRSWKMTQLADFGNGIVNRKRVTIGFGTRACPTRDIQQYCQILIRYYFRKSQHHLMAQHYAPCMDPFNQDIK